MGFIKGLLLLLTMVCGICANAQDRDSLMQQIKLMTKETDPALSRRMMTDVINNHQLQEVKDAETIDMMKGIVAMNYLKEGQYNEFDKMVSSIRNKFNQTSYLNMAAATLLKENKDLERAESLAKNALDLYLAIKDDPNAKPADYPEADWKRFMKFAYYPYADTYANALYARGKYKEALDYQEKSFDRNPENGLPASVERYANLLVKNNQSDKAYSLLLEMAKTGKSTDGMNKLLKELYVKKQGDAAGFDDFFADLQKNVVVALKEKLKKKMQLIEAPSFTLKDLEGKTVSLSDFKGKIVVVDFWATWCVPCKASFPAMKKVQQKHPEVKFLFIDTQEKQDDAIERVKKYIAENKYGFHVLMDKPTQNNSQLFQVMSAYKVEGIPTKFVIDAKGNQRFVSVGFTSDTELINEMEAMIQLVAEN
jgi:thiol-disulfide isomerase/thioredoxin